MQINFSLMANLAPARPVSNRIIHVHISGLLATDGSALNGPIETHYTTAFTPLYSNAMRVRLIAGEFLTEIPDDTINQLVWYFSNESELKNYRPSVASIDPVSYKNYRARWVTAATIVTMLAGTSINASMSKTLGDLSISRNGAANDLLGSQQAELAWLTEVLEDGGNYGRDMRTVTKSSGHPDFPIIGRVWAESDLYARPKIPGANTREQFKRTSDDSSQTRWKKTWTRR